MIDAKIIIISIIIFYLIVALHYALFLFPFLHDNPVHSDVSYLTSVIIIYPKCFELAIKHSFKNNILICAKTHKQYFKYFFNK